MLILCNMQVCLHTVDGCDLCRNGHRFFKAYEECHAARPVALWSFGQDAMRVGHSRNLAFKIRTVVEGFAGKNHPLVDLQYFLQIPFLMLGMDMPLYCKHLNVHTSKKHPQPPYPPQAHDQMPPGQCFTLLEKACDSIHFKYCNLPGSLEPPDRNIWDNNHLATNLELHFGLGFFETWGDLGG